MTVKFKVVEFRDSGLGIGKYHHTRVSKCSHWSVIVTLNLQFGFL